MALLKPCGEASVSSSYQDHRNRPNGGSQEPGTDYAVGRGTAILAAADGKVVDRKLTNSNATGRYLTIDLVTGQRVRYLHLDSINVSIGQHVTAGQVVARSGASANGSDTGVGPHVHVTLWPFQRYQFGTNGAAGTIDFHAAAVSVAGTQVTKDRQNFLNVHRGENLKVDGIQGWSTTGAYKRYQQFLQNAWGYDGGIDGVWGPKMQAAHERFYASLQTPPPNPPSSGPQPGDMLKWRWNGIQEMLRGTGRYRGAIDGIPGEGTISGFQDFLNDFGYANLKIDGDFGPATCRGAQTWLKRKYGYAGEIDAQPGSGTKAAWDAAERANAEAF